ncbi:MAG: proline racemase family protein, partial [Limisphaerales bacterium]
RRKFDHYRAAAVDEPRGSDVIVGAAVLTPTSDEYAAAVIFFNNVGVLNMCGHGTIGLLVTLYHLGRLDLGQHLIETPVGVVQATLHTANEVSVRNVPSWRERKGVEIEVPGIGKVTGDIAWGGNWFFLTEIPGVEITVANQEKLTEWAWAIRRTLEGENLQPSDGEIDHIEIFGPPHDSSNHSRNFVLCPGGAYDRSPCGTGTSAKVACLLADGKIQPGETWRQESICGSVFEGSGELDGDNVIPTIRGSAFVTSESTLVIDPEDPFCWGIH